eukprot:4591221-Pyramimonas_sp.AAC.1
MLEPVVPLVRRCFARIDNDMAVANNVRVSSTAVCVVISPGSECHLRCAGDETLTSDMSMRASESEHLYLLEKKDYNRGNAAEEWSAERVLNEC